MNIPIASIVVKLAQTKEDLEAAFGLLQLAHFENGFSERATGLWLHKYQALPSASTMVAIQDHKVIGAVCLFGDSAFKLPLETELNLEKLRDSASGRLAEISNYAIALNAENPEEIAYALFHYAVCFSSVFCHHDLIVTRIPERLENFYQEKLGFAPVLTNERVPGKVLSFKVLEASDYKRTVLGNIQAEFEFPEKKFYRVNHHVMRPETLDYFFNRLSHVFDELNDVELRALRNVYSFGKYSEVIPQRESAVIFPKLPKFKRFEMSCEGFFHLPNKKKVHFQVLDVSSNGLKLKVDAPIAADTVYMLSISIGVMKDTEVIAKSIWVKRDAGQVGMEVQSADQNWKKLIQYLESDFHQQAA